MKRLIPFLSLGWGVISVFLISRNDAGIGKLFFFSLVFAFAGIAGLFLVSGKSRLLDWLRLASQQSALQYILFFALPLLWKSENWFWVFLTGITAVSTLWDPLFNALWQKKIYRLWTTSISLILLAGLTLVISAPQLFRLNSIIAFVICCLVFLVLSALETSAGDSPDGKQRFFRSGFKFPITEIWKPLGLSCLFIVSPTPLPPLGIWLSSGEIKIDRENKSIGCETRIASPLGFKGKIIHIWEFSDPRIPREEIILSEILGNGIDEKPFRTISRKKSFGVSFEDALAGEIRCSVYVPFLGPVGKITHQVKN